MLTTDKLERHLGEILRDKLGGDAVASVAAEPSVDHYGNSVWRVKAALVSPSFPQNLDLSEILLRMNDFAFSQGDDSFVHVTYETANQMLDAPAA